MPVDREVKDTLDAFRSDVHEEVREMNAAAIRHVEKIVAPFTDVPQRLGAVEKQTTATQAETAKQTPILETLEAEAKRAKKARIDAKKERIKRSTLDEDKREREASWSKTRKRIAAGLGIFVLLAEIYHYLFVK